MDFIAKLRSLFNRVPRLYRFYRLCKHNKLSLDYAANIESYAQLYEIFRTRHYADYFPFYQRATIVDVGAHKGYFTLFAARNTPREARIIAVEPHPESYRILQDNLAHNKVTNVTAVQVGIAAEEGTATLMLDRSWSHSIVPAYHSAGASTPTLTVDVLPLTDLFDHYRLEQVDFLKMDCEGAEYQILMGADPATLARVQTLSLEFHDLRDPRYTGLALTEVLRQQHGFKIVRFQHMPTDRNRNFGQIIATRPARVR